MVDPRGSWNWTTFQHLPMDVLDHITAIMPHSLSDMPDRPGWLFNAGNKFSVKYAYNMRLNIPSNDEVSIWKLIHKSRTLPRIKSFLWLVCKDRVLTNTDRLRRHIVNTAECMICGARVEDLDHLLRQCPFAKEVREPLIRPCKIGEFYQTPIPNWIKWNLQNPSYFATVQDDWDIKFGAILWNLWSQRIVAEVGHAASLSSIGGRMVPDQRSKSIIWRPPEPNKVKLNVDGAHRMRDGVASCGGVIRDSNGTWIADFSKYIGKCSALEAEFWAVFEGLQCAWQLGYRRILVESDNTDVVHTLQAKATNAVYSSLLEHIRSLLRYNWEVEFCHVSREEIELPMHWRRCSLWIALSVG
ncbi:hypothetical protein V6N12_047853 [Hibiscus sabdariffa]|uniref:Uncharacterized protein n=1 Tax=Hibiscus sabdariffa TaxID=183260 RepID=A0ABR2CU82_9ROSI